MSGPICQEEWAKVRRESIANLQHVIDASDDPEVAVLVDPATD